MAHTTSPAAAASQLDVVFDGTWIIVPSVNASGHITGVDVYSPACGHPLGVTFITALNPNPWPASTSFYQLDPHSHTVDIQRANGAVAGMPLSGISTELNHCIAGSRPVGTNWDLMASIDIGPDAWTSTGTVVPETTDSFGNTVPCFCGKDAPTAKVSSTQTLSFYGVKALQLLGAPGTVQALLPAPWSGPGSLIFEDEIPYIPTLQHERTAIFAMANLAGLDLALNFPLPKKSIPPTASLPARVGAHTGTYCGHAAIVLPTTS